MEYLLIFDLFFIGITLLLHYREVNVSRFDRVINTWLQSDWKWLPIISLNIIFLYSLKDVLFTPVLLSFVPNLQLLAIYGVYFFLGLIIAKYEAFLRFFTFKWHYVFIGLVAYVIYQYMLLHFSHVEKTRIIIIFFYALTSYLLFTSFLGLCIRFFSKENKILRFLANASYWIYLSQIFFIILAYHLTSQFFDTLFAQFAITCLMTLFLSLITYWFFNSNKI